METNSEQIKDLLKQNEAEQLEFKETVGKDSIGSTICSFLNNKGGQVLIGVTDKKEIVGVKNADKLKKELEHFLIKELVPEAPVMVSVENYDNKELILVKVWSGSNQPYIFKGSIFYRKRDRTLRASSKEISELIHNRQISEVHWERRAVLGVSLEDFDFEEIQKTMSSAMTYNKTNESNKKPLDFLSQYGLFKNGNFTNAAVILFAKEPARFLPQARVRVSFLSEGKTGNKFIDDQILENNLFKNIDDIFHFLQKNLNYISKFDKTNWQRKSDFIYPMSALREGVLNALVHRDYSNISGSISIIIYPDRLEITNTGQLQLKISELKKYHQSILVNPDIAHIAFLRGFIEKIGRGTLKIIDACKQSGLKSPEWETDSNSVKLTLFKKIEDRRLIPNIFEGIGQLTNDIATKGLFRVLGEANEAVKQNAIEEENKLAAKKVIEEEKRKKRIEEITEEIAEGTTEGVKIRLAKIIEMIFYKPGIKTKQFIKELSVSERTIKENLKLLADSKIIYYQGSNKIGGYHLETNILDKITG